MIVDGSATSDNLTLLLSDPIEAKHDPHEPTDVPMDVDGVKDEEHQGHATPKVQHRKLESALSKNASTRTKENDPTT